MENYEDNIKEILKRAVEKMNPTATVLMLSVLMQFKSQEREIKKNVIEMEAIYEAIKEYDWVPEEAKDSLKKKLDIAIRIDKQYGVIIKAVSELIPILQDLDMEALDASSRAKKMLEEMEGEE